MEQGIIPASRLQRLDWMYNDVSAKVGADDEQENLAEEYLLGKSVNQNAKDKEDSGPGFAKKDENFVSFGANDENEAFSRMVEDPLVQMRKEEMESRSQIQQNPLQLNKV